jgi:putative transposase
MLELTTDAIEGEAPEISQPLAELARKGACRMILAALKLEVELYGQELCHLRDEQDHAMVVRNGYTRERAVQPGAGPVKVKALRVNDHRSDHRFTSKAAKMVSVLTTPSSHL